ncbi:hypothetical protein NLG97_g6436 [Lecanicillium saksenae]|uniref:Uncharacterized protein n=1 Tax=Lecanicillium saksenae TaxID=468837 RepID=A0ACC1QSR0_9HYPO|nr:hypothetical protein NLG97_g6436 [Lecanicillium saksenae]
MDYETLDSAILAVFPENCEILSVVQHGSTNWSTGLRADVLDGEDEKSYFIKIIEREELVGMAEAEYEGQKAIYSVIPDNAVKPVAWGHFSDTKSKAWFIAEYLNLRARAPPLELFLPIVKQMHQKSVSPTGKFGFHVTPYYGPPPMVVDWTDNWEEFWVREFRSGLKYVQSMRGDNPELVEIAEEFIKKVAARLLRPLQTGGRNIKPSLCHGDLWDGNIQFNVDTQQPIIFDPCSFYGHHEMDFQCMRSPRYIIGQNFIDLYKVKVGASEPSEDFEDRIALYSVRNDLMVAGMWPQWASLIDKAKDEMKRLLEKYPNGLQGFKGSLEPTISQITRGINEKLAINHNNGSGATGSSEHSLTDNNGSKEHDETLASTSPSKNADSTSKSADQTMDVEVENLPETPSISECDNAQPGVSDPAEDNDPTARQEPQKNEEETEYNLDESALQNSTPTPHSVLIPEDAAALPSTVLEHGEHAHVTSEVSLADQLNVDIPKEESIKPDPMLDSNPLSFPAAPPVPGPSQPAAETAPKHDQADAPEGKDEAALQNNSKVWQLFGKLKIWG